MTTMSLSQGLLGAGAAITLLCVLAALGSLISRAILRYHLRRMHEQLPAPQPDDRNWSARR